MKSFTSNWVFKDLVNGSGWTDESSETISQKHSSEKDTFNSSCIKNDKITPKA
jgi:hypothetical protein